MCGRLVRPAVTGRTGLPPSEGRRLSGVGRIEEGALLEAVGGGPPGGGRGDVRGDTCGGPPQVSSHPVARRVRARRSPA
ncbi:hypothetical protein ACWEKM_33405, partial [Streptomyces sp. NPDC004752]